MAVARNLLISPEEYLERERKAETKSEYLAGEVVAMAGSSRAHSLLATSLLRRLGNQLEGKPCETHGSDMRVKVPGGKAYAYPDVSVACGEPQFDDSNLDTLLNPTIIVEVLSPSTESYDRGDKFFYYRQIESLQDYLLVSQERMHIEHYTRQPNGLWTFSEALNPEDVVRIESLGCELRLAEVYANVPLAGTATGDIHE